MTKELSKPLTAPLPETIGNDASSMLQILHMSANFTKLTESGKHKGQAKYQATYSPDILKTMLPIGTHTAHICEATDAAWSTSAVVADGMSGDTEYPFGKIKVLATVGEYLPKTGYMLVGVPDGMGAYLLDSTTVRIVFQSESYGPTSSTDDSYPWMVNANNAAFTGSHVSAHELPLAFLAPLALRQPSTRPRRFSYPPHVLFMSSSCPPHGILMASSSPSLRGSLSGHVRRLRPREARRLYDQRQVGGRHG